MGRPKGSKNRTSKSISSRFWSKVLIPSDKSPYDCWTWTAFIHPSGYGTFRLNGKEILAHRMAWILTNGEIPDDKYVCHHCDNRICCNPSHLFLGTAKDNAHDRDNKGRTVVPDNRGSKHGMSKLTEEDVLDIREFLDWGVHTQSELADKYGVDRRTINKIYNRRAWSWLNES